MALLPEHPRLWRGARALPPGRHRTLAQGALSLPLENLSECLLPAPGHGEWQILAPLLADWSGPVLLIAPPYIPYPPALLPLGVSLASLLVVEAKTPQRRLWAAETALRSGCRPLVLAWVDRADFTALRRLKLAAAEGRGTLLLFRPLEAAAEPSPAALRFALQEGRCRLLKGSASSSPPSA